MSTAYVDYPNSELSYGYGWTVKHLDGNGKRIAHNGSNGAYSHSLIWYPEKDIYIVYATNANSEKVEFLAYRPANLCDHIPYNFWGYLVQVEVIPVAPQQQTPTPSSSM